VGLIFIAIILFSRASKQRLTIMLAAGGIYLIYFIVSQMEESYKAKGWYGPKFTPPDGYIRGPLSRDQGNNI